MLYVAVILIMVVATLVGLDRYIKYLKKQNEPVPPCQACTDDPQHCDPQPTFSQKKIQFILKQRDMPYENETYSYGTLHSGLYNSARFMSDMLNDQGHISECIHVVDNNSIDKEVTRFKPDIVIIEAFWVVPEKFDVLTKLHPKVKWVIRNHSKVPFLANEGIAFDWIMKYAEKDNVFISSNSIDTNWEVREILLSKKGWTTGRDGANYRCPLLMNYYPMKFQEPEAKDANTTELHVGCFGAVRPLKNHMQQAIAAIKLANDRGVKLYFHINGNRIENNGNNVLKNLRSLFDHSTHELVEHSWMPHDQFLKVIDKMDICMQVSYTETFNIVAADVVSRGIPLIVSKEIDWVDECLYVDPNDSEQMADLMNTILDNECSRAEMLEGTLEGLASYNKRTVKMWLTFIADVTK